MTLYILDVNVQTETIKKLAKGHAEFILLRTIKEDILRLREEEFVKSIHELEEKGLLWVREDVSSEIVYQDDRLIELCNELKSYYSVTLLSNDFIVKAKAKQRGICVKRCV